MKKNFIASAKESARRFVYNASFFGLCAAVLMCTLYVMYFDVVFILTPISEMLGLCGSWLGSVFAVISLFAFVLPTALYIEENLLAALAWLYPGKFYARKPKFATPRGFLRMLKAHD